MKYFISAVCCVLVALSGCSSPEPEYYTLSSIAGTPHAGAVLKIKVRRPVIPSTLDRPEMVIQSGEFRIKENESHQWSEPLDTMIERILTEDLQSRLPHNVIVNESSAVTIKAPYVLDVEIQQFGTDAQGNAILQAQAVIRRPDGKIQPLPVLLHGGRVTSAESMAKALSILLAGFSDNAAAAF